jgi:hypothetical protein
LAGSHEKSAQVHTLPFADTWIVKSYLLCAVEQLIRPASGSLQELSFYEPAFQKAMAAGLENYRWQSHCHGLFELAIAA